MLTDKAVRAAAPKDKAYKVSDSGGLFLHISLKNHKPWRFKYRMECKEQLHTLGVYPDVSLAEPREKRNDARKLLREGRNPRIAANVRNWWATGGPSTPSSRPLVNGTQPRSPSGNLFTPMD